MNDLPANDAFTLNSRTHRHRSSSQSSQTSYNSQTTHYNSRSPPPKISHIFDFGEKKNTNTNSMNSTIRQRRSSISKANTDTDKELTDQQNGNGEIVANGHSIKEKVKEVKKIDWEIPRKILHSSIGFFTVPLFIYHASPSNIAIGLSGFCAFVTSVDIIRLRNKQFAHIYEKFFGFLMRESEKHKTNGVIWYLLGCIFVLSFYPQDIAVASILILSWCDTTASFFGRLYGAYTPPLPQSMPIPFSSFLSSSTPPTCVRVSLPFARRKSVAGFIAGATTGALIVFAFWTYVAPLGAIPPSLPSVVLNKATGALNQGKLALVAGVVGVLAGVAEAIDIGTLDDNLTLPIISGGIIWAIFKTIEYFFP